MSPKDKDLPVDPPSVDPTKFEGPGAFSLGVLNENVEELNMTIASLDQEKELLKNALKPEGPAMYTTAREIKKTILDNVAVDFHATNAPKWEPPIDLPRVPVVGKELSPDGSAVRPVYPGGELPKQLIPPTDEELYGAKYRRIDQNTVYSSEGMSPDEMLQWLEGRPPQAAQTGVMSSMGLKQVAMEEQVDLATERVRARGQTPKFVVMKKPKGEALHDRILATSFDPLKPWMPYLKKKRRDRDAEGLYAKLFKRLAHRVAASQRFVLDRSAMDVVLDLAATIDEKKIAGMLALARLPYQRVYVEYDQGYRNQVNLGFDKDRGMCAFLLERVVEDDPCLFTATYIAGGSHVDFGGCGYLISTDGREMPDGNERDEAALKYHDMGLAPGVSEPARWKTVAERQQYTEWLSMPWGLAVRDSGGVSTALVGDQLLRGCRPLLPGIVLALRKDGRRNTEDMLRSIWDGRGDMRFLVALLSMMNCIPVKTVVREHAGSTFKSGRIVPYHSHSTVRIDLAKTVAVRKVIRFAAQAHKRWHPVRGHWVTFQRGDGPLCRKDAHQWAVDSGDKTRIRCMVCPSWRTWRELPKGRGDPTIGVVSHDYEVSASRRPSTPAFDRAVDVLKPGGLADQLAADVMGQIRGQSDGSKASGDGACSPAAPASGGVDGRAASGSPDVPGQGEV